MQSPAAMPELPFTLCSMCDHMLLGAVQMGAPSEPRIARITPCVSTRFPAPPCEKVLNTTAGSASLACRRITTGVLMTCTKSGYSRSARTLRLWVVSSGPSGVVKGHHHACSGGSNEPCGMKMQAGSACLHCALAGMHWPLLQKFPGGQLRLAQAVGCVTGWAALHVPVSSWQTPSPQSESWVQRPEPPGPTLQSSTWGSQFSSGDFLSTQASKHTAKIANFPRPIPHLPRPAGKVGSRLSGGKLPGVRQETLPVVA